MTDENADQDPEVHLDTPEPAAETAAQTEGPALFILETVLAEVRGHAAEERSHEIGGILVGSVTDGTRPVVLIEGAIRGTAMTYTRGSVTFTHDTWNAINLVKDEKYPDLKIVGWYHSHPGFGLFLSGHDLFIHRNFFSAPWQLALVADPIADTWGCFTWHGTELLQDPGVHTVAVEFAADEPAPAREAAPAPPAAMPHSFMVPSPQAARDRGFTWALGMLALLLTLLIGVTLATYYDLQRLNRQVETLNRQGSTLSHELTQVRDRLLEQPERESVPAPPAAPPAAVEGAQPSPTPYSESTPGVPLGASQLERLQPTS